MSNLSDVLWAHVLPNLSFSEFLNLFQKCIDTGDHSFIREFMLPAFQCYDPNVLNSLYNIHFRDRIVNYAISVLDVDELHKFLNVIKFPPIDTGFFSEINLTWEVIVGRGDPAILRMFIKDCPTSTWNAYHAAINKRHPKYFQMILDEAMYCPALDHFLRILWVENQDLINVFLDNMQKYNMFRDFIREEFKTAETLMYNNFMKVQENPDHVFYMIENLSNLLYDIRSNKRSRWTWKQLRRMQKVLGVPGVHKLVKDYIFMLDEGAQQLALENDWDEIDW